MRFGHRRITKDFSSLVFVLNSWNAILKFVVSSRDWKSHSRKLQVRKSTYLRFPKRTNASLAGYHDHDGQLFYHSWKFLQNWYGMLRIVCVHEYCKEMFSSSAWHIRDHWQRMQNLSKTSFNTRLGTRVYWRYYSIALAMINSAITKRTHKKYTTYTICCHMQISPLANLVRCTGTQ